MKNIHRILAVGPLLAVCGCSSIIDGKGQKVAVSTNPPAATCAFLSHGESLGSVQTPGELYLKKTKYDINIKCSKEGYQETAYLDHSDADAWTFGNAIFGGLGLIGWGIDSANGADNKYDSPVNLTLIAQPAPPAVPPAITVAPLPQTGIPQTGAPQPIMPQSAAPQAQPGQQPVITEQTSPALPASPRYGKDIAN